MDIIRLFAGESLRPSRHQENEYFQFFYPNWLPEKWSIGTNWEILSTPTSIYYRASSTACRWGCLPKITARLGRRNGDWDMGQVIPHIGKYPTVMWSVHCPQLALSWFNACPCWYDDPRLKLLSVFSMHRTGGCCVLALFQGRAVLVKHLAFLPDLYSVFYITFLRSASLSCSLASDFASGIHSLVLPY